MAKKIKRWSIYGKQENYDKRSKEYKIYNGINREKRKRIGPITLGQAIQQNRFGLVNKTVAQFKEIWPVAQQYKPRKDRAVAVMFRSIYDQAVRGEFPDFYIDYAAIRLPRRYDMCISDVSISVSESGFCSVVWKVDELGNEPFRTRETSFIAFVLNATKNIGVTYPDIKYRNGRCLDLLAPGYTAQDEIHVWILIKRKMLRSVCQCGYASTI